MAKAPKETKAQKFTRLAAKRQPKAINALKLLALLGNVGLFQYTPAQAKALLGAIENEVGALRGAFANPPTAEVSE